MLNSIKSFIIRYVTVKNSTLLFFALSIFFTLFFSYFYFTGVGKSKLPEPVVKIAMSINSWFTNGASVLQKFDNTQVNQDKEKQNIFFIFSNDTKGGDLRLALYSNLSEPVKIEEVEFEFLKSENGLNVQILNNDGDVICENKNDSGGLNFSIKCNNYNLTPSDSAPESAVSDNADYVLFLRPDKNINLSSIDKVKFTIFESKDDTKIKDIDGKFIDNTEFTNFYDITKSPQEFVLANNKFNLNAQNEIVLPVGTYVFSNNIIIPRNTKLIINPGVNINLTNNASFISYSPVIAKGTEKNKIYIRGEADGKGENFAVLDNNGISEFEYVEFSGGGETTVNGAYISGMLGIHHAESIIKHCKFENAMGDDSLNIKFASSTIAYNLFEKNSSDAIDYDFSTGVIEHNLFINNGNDGIDTSGSSVLIQFNDIKNSGDKCMSIGEKSTPIVFNNILNGCNIGIEIKDMSEPFVINNVIINNKTFGINEYQKKPIFGGGNGHIYNSIVWDNADSITLDSVSKIDVSNSAVQGDYVGKDNFTKKPVFSANFTNDIKNANIKYRTGGDKDVVEKYLNIKLDDAPVGLIYGFESGI